MTPKEIVVKEPFKRIAPYSKRTGYVRDGEKIEVQLPDNHWKIIPQEQFLSELYPSGHQINLRPDKMVTDDKGQIIGQPKPVAKIAIPFQEIISTKQKIHLATNPIKWTLTELERTPDKEKSFVALKQAWIDKNMHVALSQNIDSVLTTGDTALCFYRHKKKLGWKQFGFKNGDVLFPHYDYYGNLTHMGRMYRGVNTLGREVSMLDVFDDVNVTRYKKDGLLSTGVLEKWKQISKDPHGFSQIPIAYKRNNDVCWGSVQNPCDSFEESISNMSENNRYYANMILFIKGKVEDLPDRDRAGKVLSGDESSDAKFLATPESNQAQDNELNWLLKEIFMGSFTVSVSPDTVKSGGDLPGITVKLLFSPATEKANDSAKEWDSFIDQSIALFKEGYGIEMVDSLNFDNLKVRGEIDVYIPQNDYEQNQMINEAVFAGVLSRETGAEKTKMGVEGEYSRVKEEQAVENAGSLDIVNNNLIEE